MPHDFDKFPELTNNQFDLYYHISPHRQITEDFRAEVTRVMDGDTIEVEWYGRDFRFPVRFLNIAAPEKKERGGTESQSWLENLILGKKITVGIHPDLRVEKWGRLLGYINFMGMDVGERSIRAGKSVPWHERKIGTTPNINREVKKWR